MSDNRTLKLLEAFSGVEEDLLERCESAVVVSGVQENTFETGKQGNMISLADKLKKNFKKNSWRYGSAIAAVFCLAIVGLASLSGLRVTMNDSAAFEAVMDETAGGAAAPSNGTAADGAMQEAASAPTSYYTATESAETGCAEGQTTGSADDVVGSANGIASGQMNAGNAAEKVEQESGGNDAVSNSEEKSASIEEMKDSTGPRLESAVVGDSIEGCKAFVYVTVAEEEARAHERFGGYVPTKLPGGYALEGAYVNGEGESESLMVSWSRGMDSIMINITLPKAVPVTVDVAKTETYDEYLYEIPHAETVPAEYREVFNNPVCSWEDFSLEFVQKRMIAREDAGDTGTPRGNFSVLYPDGVLVHFNGRGTAEEIWALFDSMDVNK